MSNGRFRKSWMHKVCFAPKDSTRLHIRCIRSHLGLARANALAGDKAKSRKAYGDFLRTGKTRIPISQFFGRPKRSIKN